MSGDRELLIRDPLRRASLCHIDSVTAFITLASMRAAISGRGQITIPAIIRRKLKLRTGTVLEFDENTDHLKATISFDLGAMFSVIGCAKKKMPKTTCEEWLNETRGPVALPPKPKR